MKPKFKAGDNIAIKVPEHEFEQTVVFYRDILSLTEIAQDSGPKSDSIIFEFGGKVLWIDRSPALSQAETWLEIITDNVDAAENYLLQQGCTRCDGIEPLPQGFKGFWISSPSNIIHLINQPEHN